MLTSRATRKIAKRKPHARRVDQKRDHVAYVIFNRPEVHNSFNPEMLVLLGGFWEEAEKDDEVRAVIVTGAGKVAFSAARPRQTDSAVYRRAQSRGRMG